MTERYDFCNDKFTKMLRFFSVVEAYGLIYPRPSGEDSSFACLVQHENFTCIVSHAVDIDLGNLSSTVFCNLILYGDSRF